ncbi:Piso0_002366 [Millerozyma farinosa CBS 7064]|uniref:Phosphatidylinositol N-acetylglucosaminyltransferase GPI3 subunit n=1 Tax=Pichia sorbitophila (strain ATCC MYA-4447 / BCRC 22081 / CBS 7064 / NBRC 10061 / NRRL Y-12695) TaxID=559304 RepID=G8YEV2_PICSO|nr:Piso0_002366 [Millerozyma farinosa CBS 7064]
MGYNVAMVTDFFYPQPGGVEFHVYHLSQKLIDLGHSVVIITHDYGSRTGIRTLTNGLKVYYVPFSIIHRNSTSPTVFSAFPILRNIFIRESIDIVHGHGSLSTLCHEGILHGRTMGLKTVFTDHSLFGFSDVYSIIGNKLLKFTLSDIGHVICVSHTCKENTVLRASIDPLDVSVIPNAVIADDFKPSPVKKPSPKKSLTIVVISRLFQNKGADLLTAIIPIICANHPEVNFLIAGDGPKFLDLEQMREKYYLQEKVKLIGAIKHEEVRDVMIQGDIYLHPSLTEAFGTVLVEAASCGLFVVTTNVGGIPEVLPQHMTAFSAPDESSLVKATSNAINMMQSDMIDTSKFHQEVTEMYSWENIAKRTENVYDLLYTKRINKGIIARLQKYYCCGLIAGKLFVLCVLVDIFILLLLDWFYPADNIDKVTKWPKKKKKRIVDTNALN